MSRVWHHLSQAGFGESAALQARGIQSAQENRAHDNPVRLVCQLEFVYVVFDKTKSGKTRLVEINSEVRQILLERCKGKQPDDCVWINPATGEPYRDIKRSFRGAVRTRKIRAWSDYLWATFARGWVKPGSTLRHRKTHGPRQQRVSAMCGIYRSVQAERYC